MQRTTKNHTNLIYTSGISIVSVQHENLVRSAHPQQQLIFLFISETITSLQDLSLNALKCLFSNLCCAVDLIFVQMKLHVNN